MNSEKTDVEGVFSNLIKAQCSTSSNFINNFIEQELYLCVGTGYPCAGHNMSTFCNNLDLKDSAIIGNLGAVELTGSSIFLRGRFSI